MTLFKYIINPSPIGEITIIWRKKPKFQIEEIILSRPDKSSTQIAEEKYEQEGKLPINKKSKWESGKGYPNIESLKAIE